MRPRGGVLKSPMTMNGAVVACVARSRSFNCSVRTSIASLEMGFFEFDESLLMLLLKWTLKMVSRCPSTTMAVSRIPRPSSDDAA